MGGCFSSSSRRHRDLVDEWCDRGSYYDFENQLRLHEAMYSSLRASTAEINNIPQVHNHSAMLINYQEEQENQTEKKSTPVITQKEPEIKTDCDTETNADTDTNTDADSVSDTDSGSSDPSKRFCIICMDKKPISDIFKGTTSCTHSYCNECTIRYVETRIQENASRIKCPDVECTRLIEPYTCRDLIPKDVYERWDKILCESLIVSWDKHYCPFEDCSAMMVADDEDANVTQTECPSCHRLFCAQCQVVWHAGIECEELQRFGNTKKKSSEEEDAMLIKMAKSKQWRKCPNCKYYVEKSIGCRHIRCRCGFEFCYGCGSTWTSHLHRCPNNIPLTQRFMRIF